MAKPTSLLKGFEKTVETVRANPAKRQVIFDEATTGLALIVSPKGKRGFSIVARDPAGKQVWKSIGEPGKMSITDARVKARMGVERIKAGEGEIFPVEKAPEAPETFKVVAERFLERWVRRGGKNNDGVPLRSAREVERHFKTYIYPAWEARPFLSVRRGVVAELMDSIQDKSGTVQADRVLATLAKMFNWYRIYDENYVSPIIPEMRKSGSSAKRAGRRILSDDEIRALWQLCPDQGTFGALVQTCLLTAQRRAKVAAMRWEDIQDGVWIIPEEPREKVNAGTLKLPKMALDIINSCPKVAGNSYVFAGRGKTAFNSFSQRKRELDEKLPIPSWVIHDLRRTARSLMARAGVRPDIAERALGHVITGVEGTYDRHAYTDEKGEALAALAALVERIVNPPADNVVELAASR